MVRQQLLVCRKEALEIADVSSRLQAPLFMRACEHIREYCDCGLRVWIRQGLNLVSG